MDWKHLKTYHIKYAIPFKPLLDEIEFSKKISSPFMHGDSLSVGSMESTLRSAENLQKLLQKTNW